jgi:sigma-B regulation protein RsbU (phosphoserine phosphatase)
MAPPVFDQNTWRNLFEMGDQLLLQPTIYDQIDLIQKELNRITGAKIDVRLLERFKPLPSQITGRKKNIALTDIFKHSFEESEGINSAPQTDISYEILLQKESTILGVICLTYEDTVELSTEFKDFLNIAGRYIAGILDANRLSALKDWRYDQLALVRDVGFEIVRYRETRDLFRNTVQLIQKTFQFYFVAIYKLDSGSQKLILQASAGEHLSIQQADQLNLNSGIPFGEGLVGYCATSGKEVNSPDISSDPRYRHIDGLSAARSEICLPLMINNQLLGVLEIISAEPDAFHNNDVMVLHILSDSVALAIENAELFDDLFEKTWLSTVMLQVAEAAQAYDNLGDLFEAIVRILPLLVGVEKCAIFVQGKNSTDFYLNAHYGFDKDVEPKLAMLPYIDEAAEKFRQVVLLKIPLDFDHALLNGVHAASEDNSLCCKLVPMVAHNKVFGLLLVDETFNQKNMGKGHDSNQQDVLMAISRQIALAIENFKLKESREYEAYITAVLLQVAEMVAASGSLDETLSNIINLLPLVVGVDTALVYVHDAKTQRLQLRSTYSQSWKQQVEALPLSTRMSNKSLDLVEHFQKPVFCQIGGQSPEEWLRVDYRPFLENIQLPKTPEPLLMIFPLYIADENFGFLMVYESNEGYEVREKKIEIITGVAQQLSIAIQNEYLKTEMIKQESVRREFQLAQEIQKTFLPDKLPQIPGWEIAVRWRPALQVGGDFYDVIQISDQLYGFIVADVSDKGLPAALYMTVARTLIHAAAQVGESPLDTLQQVNRLLLENSQEGLFVTVFYVILNIETGEMVYANAGHNKPVLLRKNRNETVWLEKGGMPLGVANHLKLENKKLQMWFGDHLVMYTDGVTEARSPDDQLFGEDRLFSLVNTFSGNSKNTLIEELDSGILDFQSNAAASDDVTIFVVHRQIS